MTDPFYGLDERHIPPRPLTNPVLFHYMALPSSAAVDLNNIQNNCRWKLE